MGKLGQDRFAGFKTEGERRGEYKRRYTVGSWLLLAVELSILFGILGAIAGPFLILRGFGAIHHRVADSTELGRALLISPLLGAVAGLLTALYFLLVSIIDARRVRRLQEQIEAAKEEAP